MRFFMLFVLAVAVGPLVQDTQRLRGVLAPSATLKLAKSLEAAKAHARHVWRDTPAMNGDGSVNAYIEIARGDRRKWELNMRANERAIDRVIPENVGGYPVNYGFVPQTVSYDGDPFDALVLGPALAGGTIVRGVIVGLMHMTDEKGVDSKVVLSVPGKDGRSVHALTDDNRQLIEEYFRRYKQHEAGKFSDVPGWGTATEGLALLKITHSFFRKCGQQAGSSCEVAL